MGYLEKHITPYLRIIMAQPSVQVHGHGWLPGVFGAVSLFRQTAWWFLRFM